jgi:hypothetical protein
VQEGDGLSVYLLHPFERSSVESGARCIEPLMRIVKAAALCMWILLAEIVMPVLVGANGGDIS